jgi:hypothetical protein
LSLALTLSLLKQGFFSEPSAQILFCPQFSQLLLPSSASSLSLNESFALFYCCPFFSFFTFSAVAVAVAVDLETPPSTLLHAANQSKG